MSYLDNSTFLSLNDKNYPGESPRGFGLIPCNTNENTIMGEITDFNSGNFDNSPVLSIWGIDHKPTYDLAISILDHDIFVNPLLMSTFKQYYGDISYPIQINVINFGIYKRIVVNCTELTSGNIWRESFAVPTKSEINIPLSLSGLLKTTLGKKTIKVEISYADDIVYLNNLEINILPPEDLLFGIHDVGHNWYKDTLDAIACWVTPKNEEVIKLISDTEKRLRDIFNDDKPIVAQIKAIWDQLKIRNISYEINSYSIGTSVRASYQRICPPKICLTANTGNCLELTLIFASALEKISLDPIIILIDEHAFFGCKIDDKNTLYLETTFLDKRSFGEAVKKGKEEFEETTKLKRWKKELIISKCREEGFNPLF